MSAGDIYDIYDDDGFDADGLEDCANIYDDLEKLPDSSANRKTAPLKETVQYKAPEQKSTPSVSANSDRVNVTNTILAPKAPESNSRGFTSAAIHISNLQWWTSEDDLITKISEYTSEKNIVQVVFQEYKVNGKSRGLAYVEFTDTNVSSQVKEALNSQTICDRPCTTNYTAVTPTPFKPNQTGKTRTNHGAHDGRYHDNPGFSNNMNRTRGNFNAHRAGHSGPAMDLNQALLPNSINNFGFPGSIPGIVPQISHNNPGSWGSQISVSSQMNGVNINQGHSNSSTFHRDHKIKPNFHNHHSSGNKHYLNQDKAQPSNRRRYDH